jgi:hypothetical protein
MGEDLPDLHGRLAPPPPPGWYSTPSGVTWWTGTAWSTAGIPEPPAWQAAGKAWSEAIAFVAEALERQRANPVKTGLIQAGAEAAVSGLLAGLRAAAVRNVNKAQGFHGAS